MKVGLAADSPHRSMHGQRIKNASSFHSRSHGEVAVPAQKALSTVDVLIAFAAFTETTSGQTCRPAVLPPASKAGRGALLELRGLWHPCALPAGGSAAGGCIVPNDLLLGSGWTAPLSKDPTINACVRPMA
jgi:hypothetical protein